MSLLVDTSVWSLALRRDTPPDVPEVAALHRALAGGDVVATTGIILQELLQGVVREQVRMQIIDTFGALEYLVPTQEDHIAAAQVRTVLRSVGVQVGTIDALIARLASEGGHTLLTTDRDFVAAARHVDLRLWHPPADGGTARHSGAAVTWNVSWTSSTPSPWPGQSRSKVDSFSKQAGSCDLTPARRPPRCTTTTTSTRLCWPHPLPNGPRLVHASLRRESGGLPALPRTAI